MESRDEAAIGLLDSPGGPAERSVSEDKALREFLLSTIAPPDVISVCKNSVKAGLLLTGRVLGDNRKSFWNGIAEGIVWASSGSWEGALFDTYEVRDGCFVARLKRNSQTQTTLLNSSLNAQPFTTVFAQRE
jgi:hypothetical protein